MVSVNQQVSQLRPEFIKPGDKFEKSILGYQKAVALQRRTKIVSEILDDPSKYDTIIWSRSPWGKKWAGNASKYGENIIKVDRLIYSPGNTFYEFFVTDALISEYPKQILRGKIELEYNESITSDMLYKFDDYSITYTTTSETYGGTTYYFKKPNIVHNETSKPITSIKVEAKGYVVEWRGQDKKYYTDMVSSNQILKWSRGLWSKNLYAGGTIAFPGTHYNTTIKNGVLYCSDFTNGFFVSDVLIEDSKNIERVKLVVSDKKYKTGDSIKYYISTDDGNNWTEITEFDTYTDISNYGTKLRIKIEISGYASVEDIYIETDQFSVQTNITDDNTKIELIDDYAGASFVVSNNTETNLTLYNMRYKITNIKEDNIVYITGLKITYNI